MSLLKNLVNLVKETAEEALHTTPLEKALYNTTSNLNTIPAISDMELVADHTNYYEDSKTIIKYLNKKLKRDNSKRIILRTLDLVDFLIKNGAMRIVHEIRDEKYQLKSLKNMLGGDDEADIIEMSRPGSPVTRKCNAILELLSDEKRLEEERETASQTKNRYKGTGSHTAGFGSGSYGGYGSESYEGVGSDKPKKKREADRYGGYSSEATTKKREANYPTASNYGTGASKYDPNQGQSNLMKKLGIQEPATQNQRRPNEGKPDADSSDEDPSPNPTATTTTADPKTGPARLEAAPQKPAPKFLPPPPSKNGQTAPRLGPAPSKAPAQPATDADLGTLR